MSTHKPVELTKDITKYKLGQGELLYIPHWVDDPDTLYRELKKLFSIPEIVSRNQAQQGPRTLRRAPDGKE
jgi:hypothetical protein